MNFARETKNGRAVQRRMKDPCCENQNPKGKGRLRNK